MVEFQDVQQGALGGECNHKESSLVLQAAAESPLALFGMEEGDDDSSLKVFLIRLYPLQCRQS